MLQETRVHDRLVHVPQSRLDQRRGSSMVGLLQVLERAADDNDFLAQLADRRVHVLQGYGLNWREAAALLSGDIGWIEAHVGKLNERQRTWLDCRLQQESW